MDYIIICSAALITSGLTLFSGFGLGTLLLPVFAIFFPISIAVALTAIVHFLNNLFKFLLVGKNANKSIVFQFGLPAIFTAYLGSRMLLWLSDLKPIFAYQLSGNNFEITTIKLVIAILMVFFGLIEIVPKLEKISFEKKYLPLGGIISGFFGGLSGHQGAFRSAFLIKSGLSKEEFIATGVVVACLVDITRIFVYSTQFLSSALADNSVLLLAATVSAFLGAFIGSRLIKKVTMRIVQIIVSIMLFIIALGLASGII